MSMNLHCNEIDLWQTPTWLSYVALYDSTGKKRPKKETLHIYKEFVKSKTQGCFSSREIHDNIKHAVDTHLRELESTHINRFEVY